MDMNEIMNIKPAQFVWCIFENGTEESTPRLIMIVDDEDKAVWFRKNNPELRVEIEEWQLK